MSDAARFRFGAFEFDSSTGELRRDSIPMRLQAQPAKVLAALLERSGETVSRETLRQAVWGEATHVDFERGLNFCLAQVRSALDDSADSPRYIRTVPKRGYQFIAPVSRMPLAATPAGHPAGHPEEPRAPVGQDSPWRLAGLRLAVPLLLLSLALAAIGLAVRWMPVRPSGSRPVLRIAVTRFDNETGTPDFDRYASGLTDALVAELTTRTGYGIIGNAAILRQPRAQRDLGAIGTSLGAAYVIIGQVQRDAAGRHVLAHLIRLPQQTHVWVVRVDRPADDPLPAESELARRIADEFSRHLAAAEAGAPTHKNL
jgi:DNA-binding winged helix-turn-helix (wHTH) protein/TolB-like protein